MLCQAWTNLFERWTKDRLGLVYLMIHNDFFICLYYSIHVDVVFYFVLFHSRCLYLLPSRWRIVYLFLFSTHRLIYLLLTVFRLHVIVFNMHTLIFFSSPADVFIHYLFSIYLSISLFMTVFRLHVIVFNMRKMRNATRPGYTRLVPILSYLILSHAIISHAMS